LVPENFQGPTALLIGLVDEAAVQFAGALILFRCRQFDAAHAQARLTLAGQTRVIRVAPQAAAASTQSVGEERSGQESRNAR
jgi:hypothetical protein